MANKIFVTDKTISSWESDRTEPSIETEIKIKLSKKEFHDIEIFMKNNAKFLNESKQVDTYYQPTYRKFLKAGKEIINEWLRLGIRGNKKIRNYKNWYNNMYCDEYEVEIDNENNLDKILKILGMKEIAIVSKTRNTYFYLNKYEIALDYVENLGYFIEIEVKNYDESAMNEYDKLLKLAKNLNLNLDNIDKRGYPYHLIYSSK